MISFQYRFSFREHAALAAGVLLLMVYLFAGSCARTPDNAQKTFPGATWERISAPEKRGYSSEKLRKAQAFADSIGSGAVMIVVDGVILDAWGETDRTSTVASVRKSFLSALYGIHVHEGEIDLSETIADLGIDDNEPSLTETEKQATVHDLLKARSGVYHPALSETAAMKAMRPERGSHDPGTFWYYNNWDFNVLGTVFIQKTGKDIYGNFKTRIADPLQMEDYSLEYNRYRAGGGRLSIHSPYPFRMSARDMARFGLLYLRNGRWQDTQIIPESWVKESTASYSTAIMTDSTKAGGYGYLWWVAQGGNHFPNVKLKDGAYSARGYRGHYILVIPDKDMVIVHRPKARTSVSGSSFGRLVQKILDAGK